MFFLRQNIQYLKRWPSHQLGIAPAAHQLQRLRDELDLANAARPELDVAGALAARHVAAYLGVQSAHRGERRVFEILAEHERPYDAVELRVSRADGVRAGHRPR